MSEPQSVFLPRGELQRLLDALQAGGRRCIGPVEREGALVFETVTSVEQLPAGVHDLQAPGSYQLTRDRSPRCFAWANGPQALKPETFAPEETLWRVECDEQGLRFESASVERPGVAVIGARACDLAALALQEKHFRGNGVADPPFTARREAMFIVAVDCSFPADTCFCASTGDGPAAASGFDIAMSELDQGFLLRTRSEAGRALVGALQLCAATPAQLQEVQEALARAAQGQTRQLPSRDLRNLLYERQEHPHWADIASRCLACGNCTAVCPSCFCSASEARAGLDGVQAEQVRVWDSCFNVDHSSLHGRPLRDDIGLRYRQWMTHKLAAWHDQFGRSGCTGCGRCITWCPVGIDLTAEIDLLLGQGAT